MSHFKVKSITDFKEAKLGDRIPESDYSLFTGDDRFIQFELIRDDEKLPTYEAKPGIYSVQKTMAGYKLHPTSFNNESVLEEYIHTKTITEKIKKFFQKIDLYEELRPGETPKRGFLLFGAPGCGKSQTISKVCRELNADSETLILIWHTSKFEASEIKDFIQSFSYVGVKKMVLVAEDIGGVEIDEVRMRSDSSLLSLLDNVEKTFTIPTIILATTNHPEIFLGNLTNRPQRFDQCIEVKPPAPELRGKFLEFFSQSKASEAALKKIVEKKCEDFSIAHIKECVIRAALEDVTIEESIDQICAEIARYKKAIQDKKSLGLGFHSD